MLVFGRNIRKLFAFTLAEVLITLGIIGVVSAMTIPNIIHAYQKRVLESVLKEDYSLLQQVVKLNIANDNDIDPSVPDNLAGVKEWFYTYLSDYIRFEQVCFETTGCWHSNRKTRNLAGNSAMGSRIGIGLGGGIMSLRMANGSSICIDGFRAEHLKQYFGINSASSGAVTYVDVNGDKNPNVIGKDIFVFVFTDKGFVPAGSEVSSEIYRKNCSSEAKSQNAGYFCAMKVKENGWVIPDDLWHIKQ